MQVLVYHDLLFLVMVLVMSVRYFILPGMHLAQIVMEIFGVLHFMMLVLIWENVLMVRHPIKQHVKASVVLGHHSLNVPMHCMTIK